MEMWGTLGLHLSKPKNFPSLIQEWKEWGKTSISLFVKCWELNDMILKSFYSLSFCNSGAVVRIVIKCLATDSKWSTTKRGQRDDLWEDISVSKSWWGGIACVQWKLRSTRSFRVRDLMGHHCERKPTTYSWEERCGFWFWVFLTYRLELSGEL